MQKQIMTSSLWMLGGNGLQQILQFVIFILLARLLAPEIFGYVALAFVFLDVAGVAGKWGLNDMLLQRQKTSRLFISHAFVFSMSLAFLIVLMIAAGTGIYIYFYGLTLMAKLMLLLVPVVILQAAEMVPETLVRKNMDFKRLAYRNNLAALLGGVAALVLAFYGMGVYALVIQRFVSLAILLAMVWAATGKEISLYPLRRYSRKIFYGIGRIGFHMVSSPLSAILGPRLSDLLVGVVLGPIALGHLKIARRIFDFTAQLAIMPLSNVAQAAFPKLSGDPEELKKIYKRVQGVCALAVLPLFAGIAITANLWVPLMIGKQWDQAIVLIQWVSLSALPAIVNYFQIPLLIAFRENKLLFNQNIARVVLGVIGSGIGVTFGLVAVVQMFVLVAYGFMIFNWIMIRKIAGWSIMDNVGNIWPAFFATSVMLAGIWTLHLFAEFPNPWLDLTATGLAGAALYSLTLLIFFPKKTLRALKEVKMLISRKKELKA